MKKWILIVFAFLACGATSWAVNLDVYTVGNSLTDGMGLSHYPGSWDKRGMLQSFVASGGAHTIGLEKKCNVAGAPLNWMWDNSNYTALSTSAPWDALTLQPFGRPLYDDDAPPGGSHSTDWGMINAAKNFINYGLTNSPNVQPYLYSSWPGVPNYKRHSQYTSEINPETGDNYTWEEADAAREQAMADFHAAGGFDGHWDTEYTNVYTHPHRMRDFFEQAVDIFNTDRHTPGDPLENLTQDVLIIPVGDVLYEINQRMKANPTLFPRAASAGGGYYTNVMELHADVPHLRGGVGRFVCAATWYATLYGKSPAGLDYTIYNDPDPTSNQYYDYADPYYEEITTAFAAAVYEAAWDVVSTHSRAGVATADADADGLPDWWELEYYGGPTNANPNATASNGVNAVEDTYVAGLDPTDPEATFQMSDLSHSASNTVLQWSGVYGREYTVYWTSNLLSGFQPLESNIVWTAMPYTDTNHTDDVKGFYKIEVELE